MDLTPMMPPGRQIIESYGDGRFRVSSVVYQGSVVVFPDRVLTWSISSFALLDIASLGPVLEAGRGGSVELLLIGCGQGMSVIPRDLRSTLREAGIAVETMDTGAAARTYNVLMAEGRRVVAALIAV